jgi:DNA polymerase III subunit epsilon
LTSRNQDMTLLETILRELDEAIVVCDRHGLILLCNQAARSLFRQPRGLVLGGSLFEVCNRAPILHALRILEHRTESETSLVCATVDNTILLHCRIRSLTPPGATETLLLFTFADLTGQLTGQGRAERKLSTLIEALRRPLANVTTAAANLQEHPRMSAETRRDFEEIIARESTELAERFEALVREYRAVDRLPWPLTDVNSADLFGWLVQRLAGEGGTSLTITGVPLWLRADSYSLILVLEKLVGFVREIRGVKEIDLEALLGDRRVYLDLVWPGEPIAQGDLDRLLHSPLPESGGGGTVAEVLFRHDSEIWSQPHNRPGYSLLRLPVPHSPRQWQEVREPEAERHEFYDFSLAGSRAEPGDLADRPLASLDYVVFDTETTGLHPAAGDEILAIAAVRIVNGRILSGERFERLIRPQRPIPANSASFLAITGEMVEREAPVAEVLPRFRSFIDEAVMVAHNGAFDLNFFRSLEEVSGVRFDNPLLDTLLLSLLIDAQRTDLTLGGIGRWLGVEVSGSRTLMGECFITAQIFLRLLELLAERGLTTLGQVLDASARLVEKKRAQAGSGRRDA